MNRLPRRSVLAISVLAVLSPAIAAAQDAPASQQDPVQLEAVSVTAQRREEELQKTPMTISVVSGEQLDRMQIKRVDDMRFATPNIIIEQNTGTSSSAKIILRGVGADESMFTNDPAVAMYIDDVYIPRQNGAMFDLYDVERVEVLRGPQGTLYGRNATGGAIRYISKKPIGRTEFKLDGSIGNIGRLDGRAMFQTNLGEGLDMNAAVLTRNRDGILHDQVRDRMVNDQDVKAGRFGLTWSWGEASYATLSVDHLHERSTPAWATPVQFGAGDTVVPTLGSFYETRTDALGLNKLDQTGIALTNDTQFENFNWRSILHYRELNHHFYMDVDGTDQMRYHLEQDQNQNQKGYEAQFTSTSDSRLQWVAGVFTFFERNNQPTRNDIFARGATNFVEQDTAAYAVYGQGTWSFSDRLRLTAGARYSRETKDFNVRVVRTDGSLNFEKRLKETWTRPDWKLLLDFDFTDNIMGYASATTGFKSGGYNGRGTTYDTILPVDAETLIAYEAGIKSTLWNNRIRLNGNYYRLDYDGIQLTAVNADGVFVMTNATGALIQGFELDLAAQLTRQLNINASLGTIDGEYQKYSDANAAYFRGRSMKSAPDLQWTLGASWVQPVGDADLVFSAQARHTDEYYQNQDTSRLIMTRANTEANVRISYEPRHGRWALGVWGRNLGDKFISTGGFHIPGLGIGVIYPNVPRTYGIEFKYNFNK